MSCQVLSDEQIDTLVYWFASSYDYKEGKGIFIKNPLFIECMKSEVLFFTKEEEYKLKKILVRMNVDAYNDRYKEEGGGVYSSPYKRKDPPSLIEVFKTLSCYLYNCSEGGVVERDMYKQLKQYQQAFACEIIMKSQEWNDSPGW
jgi:hypothetical protein